MAKERIYELAKELKMPSKALVKLANENGVAVKSHMSSVTSEQAAKLRSLSGSGNQQTASTDAKKVASQPKAKEQLKHEHQAKANQHKQREAKPEKQHANKPQSKPVQVKAEKEKSNQPNHNESKKKNKDKDGNRFNNKNGKKNKKGKRNRQNQRMKNIQPKQPTQRKDKPLPDVLEYTDGMNAQDLAKVLHRPAAEIVKKLFMLGVMVNQNQSLEKDTIEILAADYGIEAKEKVQEVDGESTEDFLEGSAVGNHLAWGYRPSESITEPSIWYGVAQFTDVEGFNFEEIKYDIWGEISTYEGQPYIELFMDMDHQTYPILSMFINGEETAWLTPIIREEDAWITLDPNSGRQQNLNKDDEWGLLTEYKEGALDIYHTYTDDEGGYAECRFFIREDGTAWNEASDPLPPRYEAYKEIFSSVIQDE